MQTRLLPLLLALAVYPAGAGATSTDREQPVHISADWASLDDRKRVATYRGNVVLTQGSLRITGRLVTMYFDEGYDLERLVSEGEPARFEQKQDNGTLQKGKAARIEYRTEDGAMLFAGNARIAQGEFQMQAEHIHYDSVTGSIQGTGTQAETDEGRVTIILQDGKQ